MTTDNAARASGFRSRLGINTVASFVGKFGGLVVSLLLIPYMVTRLGDTGYGLWVLVTSIVAYGSLADFGIAAALTKYVSESSALGDHAQCRATIAAALRLYALIGLALAVLIAAFAPLVPGLFGLEAAQHRDAIWLTVLLGISVGLSIPCAASIAVLHGLHRFDITAGIGLGRAVLFALGVVVSLAAGGGLLHVAVAQLLAMLLVQIPAIVSIRRLAPEMGFGFRGAEIGAVRRILSFSWPLFMVSVGGQMQSKTDEIVIGARLPVGLITPYSFALLLSRVPQLFAEQFVSFFLPIASEYDAKDEKEKLRNLLLLGTRSTLTVFLPLGGTIAMLSGPILGAWVGEQYEEYSTLVWVLCAALMLDTMQWPAAMVMQGMNRHRLFGFVALATGISNIVLSLALIPYFGLLGVALGTLLTAAAETAFVVLPYACRSLGIGPGRFVRSVVAPVVMPTAAMAAALVLVERYATEGGVLALAVSAAIAVSIYGAVFLALPQAAPERAIVRSLFESIRDRR